MGGGTWEVWCTGCVGFLYLGVHPETAATPLPPPRYTGTFSRCCISLASSPLKCEGFSPSEMGWSSKNCSRGWNHNSNWHHKNFITFLTSGAGRGTQAALNNTKELHEEAPVTSPRTKNHMHNDVSHYHVHHLCALWPNSLQTHKCTHTHPHPHPNPYPHPHKRGGYYLNVEKAEWNHRQPYLV